MARKVHDTLKVITFSAAVAQKIHNLTEGNERIEVKQDFDGNYYIGIGILDDKKKLWRAIQRAYPGVTIEQIKNNFSIIPYVFDDEDLVV